MQADAKKISAGFHKVTTVELVVGVGSVLGFPKVVCLDMPFISSTSTPFQPRAIMHRKVAGLGPVTDSAQ